MTDLGELIKQAVARLEAMTPLEREVHWKAQRESFVRAMNTPCEHGQLDFEQCDQCRGRHD
jgi:hypothetical protein